MTEISKVTQFSGVNTITEAEFNSAKKIKDAAGKVIYVFEEDDGSGITKISEEEYGVYASTFARKRSATVPDKKANKPETQAETSWLDGLKGFAKKHPIFSGLCISPFLGVYGAKSDEEETQKTSFWEDLKGYAKDHPVAASLIVPGGLWAVIANNSDDSGSEPVNNNADCKEIARFVHEDDSQKAELPYKFPPSESSGKDSARPGAGQWHEVQKADGTWEHVLMVYDENGELIPWTKDCGYSRPSYIEMVYVRKPYEAKNETKPDAQDKPAEENKYATIPLALQKIYEYKENIYTQMANLGHDKRNPSYRSLESKFKKLEQMEVYILAAPQMKKQKEELYKKLETLPKSTEGQITEYLNIMAKIKEIESDEATGQQLLREAGLTV